MSISSVTSKKDPSCLEDLDRTDRLEQKWKLRLTDAQAKKIVLNILPKCTFEHLSVTLMANVKSDTIINFFDVLFSREFFVRNSHSKIKIKLETWEEEEEQKEKNLIFYRKSLHFNTLNVERWSAFLAKDE